jgi:hypothetical protein
VSRGRLTACSGDWPLDPFVDAARLVNSCDSGGSVSKREPTAFAWYPCPSFPHISNRRTVPQSAYWERVNSFLHDILCDTEFLSLCGCRGWQSTRRKITTFIRGAKLPELSSLSFEMERAKSRFGLSGGEWERAGVEAPSASASLHASEWAFLKPPFW